MAPRGLMQTRLAGAVAWLSIAGLVMAAPVGAQERERNEKEGPQFLWVDPTGIDQSGRYQDYDVGAAIRRARSEFRLFGDGDRGFTSLRMVGDNHVSEQGSGPCDENIGPMWDFQGCIRQFGTSFGSSFETFGIPLHWGAPRSEWVQYLIEGVESLRNAQGTPPGWTVLWNAGIFNRPKDFNAADGLVGTLLSGVVSTDDGSCLDHTASLGGAGLLPGFQLLPGSNCPPTWSSGGTVFLGDRPITPDTWAQLFNEQGSAFQFNRWQVPADRKDQTKFLGNNFATYGHFNDYNSSTLRKFGNVVPGGTGDPTRDGYPLGLDVYFDSYSFTLPTTANVKFWDALIVNNSEILYGVAHDYDSLYVALGPWPGRHQDGDNYMIPELGAWVSSESDDPAGARCAAIPDVPLVNTSCGGSDAGRANGFERGAHGLIVLKSPIGDLRNKLFTRAGSPFFDPSHPLAGDTITYNIAHNTSFGPWSATFRDRGDRNKFGFISATTENTLNGVACADFNGNLDRYRAFHSNTWPDAATQCIYGGFVPGDWHYTSNRPLGAGPGPDTLWLAGCGPFDNGGCPDAWADTTFQGWAAVNGANLATFSLGPFRLEAGDTTNLIVAFYSGRDSVSFETFTQGAVDFYLELFAGPEAPPRVSIADVEVGAGVTTGQDAQVTLVWDEAAEDFVDPFLSKFADDMEAAAAGTELARIRDSNPGLVQRIRDRAAANLERLLIFRSCDGGGTFDSDGDCVGDQAFDAQGGSIEPGWQAFATLAPDASGDVVNSFTDGNVTPGVSYLYSILGQSRGFTETVINDPNATVDGLGNFTCGVNPCQLQELIVAPGLLNPLSRSAADPNVSSVYVPASVTAGGSAASVEFIDRDAAGLSSAPFEVVLVSADVRDNTFRAKFGNFIQIVEERDATTDDLISFTVTVEDQARTVTETGTVTQVSTLASVSFSRDDGVPVTLNDAALVSDVTAGGVRTLTYEVTPGSLDPDIRFAEGLVLVEETASGTLPLLATGNLGGASATPGGFLSNPAFPGFFVTADQDFNSTSPDFWTDPAGDTLSTEFQPTLGVEAGGDVPNVQGLTFGELVVTFTDSVFGPLSPFRIDFNDPDATDQLFDQSLGLRSGTTGATDDETRDLVAAALETTPAEVTLVAANIPFTVSNIVHGRSGTLAMVDRGETRKVLGLSRDTISVTVAADQWIPTDLFFVIEEIEVLRTRTVGGEEAIVVDGSGTPLTEILRFVTVVSGDLRCSVSNPSCNPVAGAGSGNWIGVRPGDNLHVQISSPFTNESEYVFVPTPAVTGDDVLSGGLSIEEQLDSIRVVPNPYLFLSDFEAANEQRRLMFTNLPPDGDLRIYTVAGNFVQEIDWEPADLAGNGDLYWDLQTREGNDLGSGLYLFVVTAVDPATGSEVKKAGKFVVIR